MIEVTAFNGKKIFVNEELIRIVEKTPDTIITFVDGLRIPVLSTPEEIQKLIIENKTQITRSENLVLGKS